MEKPPILVTSDVKFAIMKDGSFVMDEQVEAGPGWFDVARVVADIVERASEDQALLLAAAKAMVFDPAVLARLKAMKDAMEKKDE